MSLKKTDSDFALKLYKNNNIMVSKIQINSFSHNVIYFKYKVTVTEKFRFNFSYPYIDQTRLTKFDSIDVF